MSKVKPRKIYSKCLSKGIDIAYACEVGVYLPQTSNIKDFIFDGIRAALVEPDPKSLKAIAEYFGGRGNIKVFPVAVFDHNGTVELVHRNASTFISTLPSSPAIVNDRYSVMDGDKFTVECTTFDRIDDGAIDLLSVDIEGSEWYVIKDLKSRPKVISVETHGKKYINPFMKEIAEWMSRNGYRVWYKDNTDTIYGRNDQVKVSIADGLRLIIREGIILLLKYKRIVRDSVMKGKAQSR